MKEIILQTIICGIISFGLPLWGLLWYRVGKKDGMLIESEIILNSLNELSGRRRTNNDRQLG